jgi:undecaprenyl phosphate-alpha-L-ara4N flippase subunit ArnE
MNAALAVAVTITLTAISQLLQKQVALCASIHQPKGSSAFHFYLRQPRFWLALLCLGIAMAAWLYALGQLEVSKAYALLSVNYLLVPLAARLFFGERLARRGWLGALLIGVGVCLIGLS